jgi:GntP family gluconate:H+ symporter
MPPLLILLLGTLLVIFCIVRLRIGAFFGLMLAAFLVSFLAAGAFGDKLPRVVAALGTAAGKLAVIITCAALIGKCMTDSGAADRIVRTFLRLLGERRAPAALMSSGFVLGMPVFFDTVFYLLVPLARSLHRSTKKNYLLYILARAGGRSGKGAGCVRAGSGGRRWIDRLGMRWAPSRGLSRVKWPARRSRVLPVNAHA